MDTKMATPEVRGLRQINERHKEINGKLRVENNYLRERCKELEEERDQALLQLKMSNHYKTL